MSVPARASETWRARWAQTSLWGLIYAGNNTQLKILGEHPTGIRCLEKIEEVLEASKQATHLPFSPLSPSCDPVFIEGKRGRYGIA
jgi:hypothetical protein